MAKELIERLHGAIWCVSTPGQGACFFRAYQHTKQWSLSPTKRSGAPRRIGMMKNLLGHAIRSERMKEILIHVFSFYPSTDSDNWPRLPGRIHLLT